jgi:hypothetical protein
MGDYKISVVMAEKSAPRAPYYAACSVGWWLMVGVGLF